MQDESQRNEEPSSDDDTQPSIITAWPILFDTKHMSVCVDGKTIRLTPGESMVLRYLAVHANTVCTPNQIGSSIWGTDNNYQDNSLIKVYIRLLRQKIEPVPNHPIYLL